MSGYDIPGVPSVHSLVRGVPNSARAIILDASLEFTAISFTFDFTRQPSLCLRCLLWPSGNCCPPLPGGIATVARSSTTVGRFCKTAISRCCRWLICRSFHCSVTNDWTDGPRSVCLNYSLYFVPIFDDDVVLINSLNFNLKVFFFPSKSHGLEVKTDNSNSVKNRYCSAYFAISGRLPFLIFSYHSALLFLMRAPFSCTTPGKFSMIETGRMVVTLVLCAR